MVKIKLICEECTKSFFREKGEYVRSQKLGRKSFCSLSCSCTYGNKKTPRGNVRNLIPGNLRDEYTEFRYFLRKARARDKKKGRIKNMNLTLSYLKKLWKEQDGICPFTGVKLNLPKTTSGWNTKEPYNASLDRIDCSVGYVKGNVRFVSYIANVARGDFTDQQLFNFCRAVTYLQEKYKSRSDLSKT